MKPERARRGQEPLGWPSRTVPRAVPAGGFGRSPPDGEYLGENLVGAGWEGERSNLFGQYPLVGEGGVGIRAVGGFALEGMKSNLEVRVAVAHGGMGTEVDDLKRQLLSQLPTKGLGSGLAFPPFAPGQFPEAAKKTAWGAPGHQETSPSP